MKRYFFYYKYENVLITLFHFILTATKSITNGDQIYTHLFISYKGKFTPICVSFPPRAPHTPGDVVIPS